MKSNESNLNIINRRTKKTSRKTLTPFQKLKKRLMKDFQKKKLIGDIIINESEYEILVDYFKTKCKGIINSNIHSANEDPIFAIALVQVGIKYYDGSYWSHVAEILGLKKINAVYQGIIGDIFINTLIANNKIILDRGEKVTNILMHGFVSDYYANEMFNFLFKYYNIDLERDLQRNDKEMMNSLIEVIKRNDNTGRTYLLVKQTANAISANIRGGKIRLRHLLKLIDKCFWEQITPVNPVSRLAILFNNWQENSDEYKLQFEKYHTHNTNIGKKSYFSPYIKCDFNNTSFKLILPTQLIKFEFDKDIKWNIYNNESLKTVKTALYPAVTGLKTEAIEININTEDLFSEFIFELTYEDNRIRLFKIKADCIRFFDRDGDLIDNVRNLPKGEVFAFTRENEIPISAALIETEPTRNLLRSYFEFEYGDVVRLPDGKPISIGKKLEEGLLRRKMLNGCHSIQDNNSIPIYSDPPSILLKIQARRANGTAIDINGSRYHLFDYETTTIELGDRSGETGYILNLGDYGCKEDGLYTVFVDVPNDRTNRLWQFALVNKISYDFEDAPYIFRTKGTIRFNDELSVNPKYSRVMKNIDENSFNFLIDPDIDYLQFEYETVNSSMDLYFEIPVFKWRFDEKQWNIEKPMDIWHSDFPSLIYIKYPDEKIKMSMDEQLDFDKSSGDQSVIYSKLKAKGIFECDTTRFKSWFGREKIVRSIFIDFPEKREEFIKVITQSKVESHILKSDFEASKLIGEVDIVGKANYYVDIVLLDTNQKLADKLQIVDGKFLINAVLNSGIYRVNVFEDEEDDTGFGISNYLPIGTFDHNLINPYNLQGKSIAIRYIKKKTSITPQYLSCQYIITNLQKVNKNDNHNYTGNLSRETAYGYASLYNNVNVQFFDLNKLKYVTLTYYDGYDYLEFLFDTNRRIIVKKEEEGLTRAVKYRRYESLYPEDYVYMVEFMNDRLNAIEETAPAIENLLVNEMAWEQKFDKDINFEESNRLQIEKSQSKETLEDEKETIQGIQQKDIMDTNLSDIGISMLVVNYLKKANIKTVRDVVEKGSKKLCNVNGINKKMHKEIILKLHSIGVTVK